MAMPTEDASAARALYDELRAEIDKFPSDGPTERLAELNKLAELAWTWVCEAGGSD